MRNKITQQRAQHMRIHVTESEWLLWQYLRKRQLRQLKFRRQCCVGNYIVDFACFEEKIVIEVDGTQHEYQCAYDEKRTHWLQQAGFNTLRFWNFEVLFDLDRVMKRIERFLDGGIFTPTPTPPPC